MAEMFPMVSPDIYLSHGIQWDPWESKITITGLVVNLTREKLYDTLRNTSCWVCPVDFKSQREMLSLSAKTVVVHNTVKSLMMEKIIERKACSS